MAADGLLTMLANYAESIGYKVVIDDSSRGDGSLQPSLIFVRDSEDAVYSISVERVS